MPEHLRPRIDHGAYNYQATPDMRPSPILLAEFDWLKADVEYPDEVPTPIMEALSAWSELSKAEQEKINEYSMNQAQEGLPAEKVKQNEFNYFIKVYSAYATMYRRHSGRVTIMTDVDKVVSDYKPGTQNFEEEGRVIRPTFRMALDALARKFPNDPELGFLTTIRTELLIQDDQPLAEAMPEIDDASEYVDRSLILDSRTIDKPELHKLVYDSNDETMLRRVESIIDPEIIAATRRGNLPIGKWYSAKLVILADLLQNPKYADRAFVFIDDYVDAAILRSDHPRIVGVNVANEAQNTLMAMRKTPLHPLIESRVAKLGL